MDEAIFINELVSNKMKTAQQFPDKAIAELFVDDIFRFLFIGSTNEVNHIADSGETPAVENSICFADP